MVSKRYFSNYRQGKILTLLEIEDNFVTELGFATYYGVVQAVKNRSQTHHTSDGGFHHEAVLRHHIQYMKQNNTCIRPYMLACIHIYKNARMSHTHVLVYIYYFRNYILY